MNGKDFAAKRVRQWLLPVLTGLVAVGAVALPARISMARDAGRFGQIYTEPLEAAAQPVSEPPAFQDRLALYASQSDHPVLSFQEYVDSENPEGQSTAQTARELLVEAEVLPGWLFEKEPFDRADVVRLLLWDPQSETAAQEPSAFWVVSWSYDSDRSHQKSVQVTLDAETGLPVSLRVHDTNMSQWLPYGRAELRERAERFLALAELDAREISSGGADERSGLGLCYTVPGAAVQFAAERSPTSCSIEPEPVSPYRTGSVSVSIDG